MGLQRPCHTKGLPTPGSNQQRRRLTRYPGSVCEHSSLANSGGGVKERCDLKCSHLVSPFVLKISKYSASKAQKCCPCINLYGAFPESLIHIRFSRIILVCLPHANIKMTKILANQALCTLYLPKFQFETVFPHS